MGIEFRETMSGSYRLNARGTEEQALSFTIRAVSRKLTSFLQTPLVEVEGEMHAVGFANHAPTRGILALNLLRDRTLKYNLRFPGNDRKTYRFQGQKEVSPWHLVGTMTELSASILDEQDQRIGSALVRFDLQRDLLSFLCSFRLS